MAERGRVDATLVERAVAEYHLTDTADQRPIKLVNQGCISTQSPMHLAASKLDPLADSLIAAFDTRFARLSPDRLAQLYRHYGITDTKALVD